MLTQTNLPAAGILGVTGDADIGVTIALASSSHRELTDGVVVRHQHLLIKIDFITKSVEASQRDPKKYFLVEKYLTQDHVLPDVSG